MKLITLNIWGGHVHGPLLQFISSHQEIDIFCFQEVYSNAPHKVSDDDRKVNLSIFEELQKHLPKHKGFFKPVVKNIYGIAMFVKKGIDILEEGEVIIHENLNYTGCGPTHSRNLQYVKCRAQNKNRYILNVHGLWNGKGKSDSPERLIQSQRIKSFSDSLKDPVVLCGDFNLRPDTQSIKIIETGLKNLIHMYDVKSTRTCFYDKEEKFADYIFLSPEIEHQSFEVLKNEVSDHAPLFVDFS